MRYSFDAAIGRFFAEDRPCYLFAASPCHPPVPLDRRLGHTIVRVKKRVPGGTGLGTASIDRTIAQFSGKIKVAESIGLTVSDPLAANAGDMPHKWAVTSRFATELAGASP
jgi:hypothetical protein